TVARSGSANVRPAADAADTLSKSRLDHFRFRKGILPLIARRLPASRTIYSRHWRCPQRCHAIPRRRLLLYADPARNDAVHDCSDRLKRYNAAKGPRERTMPPFSTTPGGRRMAKWIRFEQNGNTGFGTVEND